MKPARFHSPAWITAMVLAAVASGGPVFGQQEPADPPPLPANLPELTLASEVAAKGWICFSAKTPAGDYDLFACRPDGTGKRNLTKTPQWNEFGARFTQDGRRMLYRRVPRTAREISHDAWGAMGILMVARADGSEAQPQGQEGGWPWASWGPDGKQIACLYRREGVIRIFDLASRQLVRQMPRQGIFQQMFWSPDGRAVCGTANLNGQDWNIVAVDVQSGKSTLLSRALNCTADWFQKDPKRVIYSNRTPGVETDYGWTMLMQATADGQSRNLLYAERGRHIYFGCTSPDDKYALFSRPESDGGIDAKMAIIRIADSPIIVPADYQSLKELYPQARRGPVLHLPEAGFEPHWTYASIFGD